MAPGALTLEQERKASLPKKAVDPTATHFGTTTFPLRHRKYGSMDRAYEQALDAWMKERPDLTRAEALEAFQNDSECITRVLKFFHGD